VHLEHLSTSTDIEKLLANLYHSFGRLFGLPLASARSMQGLAAQTLIVSSIPQEICSILTTVDSKEQIAEFNADSEAYTQYARDVEGELNKRFTLVSSITLSRFPQS
jgi:hypothetical protein